MKKSRKLKMYNCIKVTRLKRNISQVELANMVGSTQTTISAIESGKHCPSVYLALLISIALGCNLDSLFALDVCDSKFYDDLDFWEETRLD